MKKFLMVALIALTAASLAFAAGGSQQSTSGAAGVKAPAGLPQINGGRPITLRVEGTMTPTLNTVPTPESPTVIQSTARLAERFTQMYPNVTIEWVRDVPNTAIGKAEWWTTQVAAGNPPAIGMLYGDLYLDRDWLWDLTDALNSPNPFIPGNQHWRDLYASYVFSGGNVDNQNRPILVPLSASNGAAISYFYNKDIFAKLRLTPPKTWEELRAVCKALEAAGYIALLPWTALTDIGLGNWQIQFNIGPGYINAMMDTIDYNHNGILEKTESARAAKAGLYNPVTNENVRELLRLQKEMYADLYPTGWQTMDLESAWNNGQAGMKMDGTWSLASEASNTRRKFDYDTFLAPMVDHNSSRFVKDVPYTEKGPYMPTVGGSNIIKPAVQNNPGMLEAAVAFMQWLTVPENLDQYLLEQGSTLGAVKGTVVPPLLQTWMEQSFPILPNGGWTDSFTTEYTEPMHRAFEMWVTGQINDNTFFVQYNDLQQRSLNDFIAAEKLDTSGW
jgi:ABC-type glycerol-3-phosphate transport system substrate-binding protein